MIKKIDKLVIKSFLGPFILSFLVVVFIFLIQYLVKYFPELVGKGLGWEVFGKLILFFSISVAPNALPLGILIGCLMSYGSLGEHFEISAIKSAGISLIRILVPVFFIALILCVCSFFLNNNIVPYANLKAFSLLYDARQKKPTLDFKEGAFYNGIPGYSIKITEKTDEGRAMRGVIIYNHTQGRGNIEVVIADSAQMYTIMDDRYLVMKLFKGTSCSEMVENQSSNKQQFIRNKYSTSQLVFNLESFGLQRTQEDLFKQNKIMRNVTELSLDADSMTKQIDSVAKQAFAGVKPFYAFSLKIDSTVLNKKYNTRTPKYLTDTLMQANILQQATNSARGIKSYISSQKDRQWFYKMDRSASIIERLRKFTMMFACLVMFLIGAPLGAIIKKGGLGVPVLIGISFFITYYVLLIVFEKWARQGIVNVTLGMWMANLVYLPIGLFFLRQAKNDSRLLETDYFAVLIDKLKTKFTKKNSM